MLLGYIDESYKRGEHYWLAVALVHGDSLPDLAGEIDRVLKILPAEFRAITSSELHGHALFHGSKAFEPLKGLPSLRIRAYRRGIEAVAKAATEIVFVGVDWCDTEIPNSLEIHRMQGVRALLPLLEGRLKRLDEHCLLIADEEETTRKDFVAAVRDHKRCCVEADGRCRIVDNVVFIDSRDSPGVQGTDLAAFLHHRIESNREVDERAQRVNRKLYAILEKSCQVSSKRIPGPHAPQTHEEPPGAAQRRAIHV